jgi:uronate dehydrogenase
MKVLLVGGSGHVGSLIAPYLKQRHDLRVLDVRPPRDASIEYFEGSITDPARIREALAGMDTFINLVMKNAQSSNSIEQSPDEIVDNYQVNAMGLHLLLFTAHELGITRGVHTSTMGVHFRERDSYPGEELVPFDAPSVYGLTKGFGEHICEYFARWFDMNIIALRITGPRAREQFLEERRHPADSTDRIRVFATDEEDLANAYLAALDAVAVGHGRFDAVFIAGDENEEEHNLSKARRLLGWKPTSHLLR